MSHSDNSAPIVASRSFVLSDGREGRLNVFAPVPEGENEWSCVFELVGFTQAVTRKIYGIDALQSLLLATELARRTLEAVREPFNWLGGEAQDSGIGQAVPTFFDLRTRRRLATVLAREEASYAPNERADETDLVRFSGSSADADEIVRIAREAYWTLKKAADEVRRSLPGPEQHAWLLRIGLASSAIMAELVMPLAPFVSEAEERPEGGPMT